MSKLVIDGQSFSRACGARTPRGVAATELFSVTIDSRTAVAGSLFIGVQGEKTHGQLFANAALSQGAEAVLVEDGSVVTHPTGCVLEVDDVVQAMQRVASFVRDQLKVPVVGITGTNGKTTTKDVVATILEAVVGPVHSTKGNLNNHLGLPLSLLNTPERAKATVFELGMSNPGEIDLIASILRPDIGVITNVGEAHLETMGSVERIVDAKAELIGHVSKEGLLVLNADCPWHGKLASRNNCALALVGVNSSSCARELAVELLDARSRFDGVEGRLLFSGSSREFDVRLPIAGLHIASSFVIASAVARYLGAEPERIVEALAACRPAWGRMELRQMGGVRVLFDGYNANPPSVLAALSHLAGLDEGEDSFVVLGEMLELGRASQALHQSIGLKAIEYFGAERVVLLGSCYESVHEMVPDAQVVETVEAVADVLRGHLKERSVLLLKASRGAGIERLLGLLFPDHARERG